MDPRIDALPYYDKDIDHSPALAVRIQKLIEAEQGSAPTALHPSVESAFPLAAPETSSSSDLINESLARLSKTYPARPTAAPSHGFDEKKYAIPPNNPPAGKKVTAKTLQEYQSLLDTLSVVSAHRNTQIANLELLSRFGANSWRINNFLAQQDLGRVETDIENLKSDIQDLHRSRKAAQNETGDSLRTLENKWTSLISNNMQLDIASFTLESEVNSLRARARELQAQLE